MLFPGSGFSVSRRPCFLTQYSKQETRNSKFEHEERRCVSQFPDKS